MLAVFSYLNLDEQSPVAVFGRPGSYTMEAMQTIFGQTQAHHIYDRFEQLFDALEAGHHTLAVVPLENSTTGSVLPVIDALASRPLTIVGEMALAIEHQLAALPGTSLDTLTHVYSHNQALFQCQRFFAAHPHLSAKEASSTAAAALQVAEAGELTRAAICSRSAARTYGLAILRPNIQDAVGNTTRFGLISRTPINVPGANKASLSFTTAHRAGALVAALQVLAYYGINMMRIESRPIPTERWNYRFFVDVDMPDDPTNLDQAIDAARPFMQSIRLLGRYYAHRGDA